MIPYIGSMPDGNMLFDFEEKNKHGIDKMFMMGYFMPVVESKSGRQLDKRLNRFKSFIVQQIKRGISPQEDLALKKGILEYLKAEPGSNDRTKAMNYLFNGDFLAEKAASPSPVGEG